MTPVPESDPQDKLFKEHGIYKTERLRLGNHLDILQSDLPMGVFQMS